MAMPTMAMEMILVFVAMIVIMIMMMALMVWVIVWMLVGVNRFTCAMGMGMVLTGCDWDDFSDSGPKQT